MPGDPPKIYWDSCVFLSWINKTADRLHNIDALLDRSGRDFQLVTSNLSVAEVAFAEMEKAGGALSDETMAKIDSLWLAQDSPVRLAEIHLGLCLDARDLARGFIPHGLGLKGADAIHLATAKWLGVKEIHTYDTKWPRYAPMLGIPIREPLPTTLPLPLEMPDPTTP
jgi:predicted nucleic acid-binding protein